MSRRAVNTKSYADAVVEVGAKLGVPVVNLWQAFMAKTGFKQDAWKEGEPIVGAMEVLQDDALVKLMYDGKYSFLVRAVRRC